MNKRKPAHLTPHGKHVAVLILLAIIAAPIIFAIHGVFVIKPKPVPEAPKILLTANRTEITHGDTSKNQVIFTFDGGATAQSGNQILDTLEKHHVTGTFFLTGKFIEANPDLVKRMVAEGYETFSHTYDHPHLPEMSESQITEEFIKQEQTLESAAHVSPKPYFRAPYGDRDARVLDIAYREGYQSVYWGVDARDWMEPQGETADEVKDRILSNVRPGMIYLMHVGDTITGSILDDVLTQIEAKGFKAVSLTQGI